MMIFNDGSNISKVVAEYYLFMNEAPYSVRQQQQALIGILQGSDVTVYLS